MRGSTIAMFIRHFDAALIIAVAVLAAVGVAAIFNKKLRGKAAGGSPAIKNRLSLTYVLMLASVYVGMFISVRAIFFILQPHAVPLP